MFGTTERAIAVAGFWRDEAKRLEAKLESVLNAPPAEMSYNGRLIPINSTGMREVIDEATRLRAQLDSGVTIISSAYQLGYREGYQAATKES